MSVDHKRELQILDESSDSVVFATTSADEQVGLDDDEAVLVTAKIGESRHVNISRADLQELRLFLEEVTLADEAAQA